jgi:hypothetical protein
MGLYSLESSANNAILEPRPTYSGISLMYTIGTGGVLGWIPVGLQRSRGASLRGSHLRQRVDICHSGNYETTEEASLICHIAQACSEACSDVEGSDPGFLGRRGVVELP